MPDAPEPDSRLDVVAPSWRGADLGAGEYLLLEQPPITVPSIPNGNHSTNNPVCRGQPLPPVPARRSRCRSGYPCVRLPAISPCRRRHAGVPRGPKSTKHGARPPLAGWHKRSNVLKLFTKVRAAQGLGPAARDRDGRDACGGGHPLSTGSSPPTEPSTPRRSSARPRTGSTVDLDDFPAEHWVHLRTTDPIESVFGTVPPHRSDHGLCAAANLLGLIFKLARSAEKSFKRLRCFDRLARSTARRYAGRSGWPPTTRGGVRSP